MEPSSNGVCDDVDFAEDPESEEITRKEGAHQADRAGKGRFLRGQMAITKYALIRYLENMHLARYGFRELAV